MNTDDTQPKRRKGGPKPRDPREVKSAMRGVRLDPQLDAKLVEFHELTGSNYSEIIADSLWRFLHDIEPIVAAQRHISIALDPDLEQRLRDVEHACDQVTLAINALETTMRKAGNNLNQVTRQMHEEAKTTGNGRAGVKLDNAHAEAVKMMDTYRDVLDRFDRISGVIVDAKTEMRSDVRDTITGRKPRNRTDTAIAEGE